MEAGGKHATVQSLGMPRKEEQDLKVICRYTACVWPASAMGNTASTKTNKKISEEMQKAYFDIIQD